MLNWLKWFFHIGEHLPAVYLHPLFDGNHYGIRYHENKDFKWPDTIEPVMRYKTTMRLIDDANLS